MHSSRVRFNQSACRLEAVSTHTQTPQNASLPWKYGENNSVAQDREFTAIATYSAISRYVPNHWVSVCTCENQRESISRMWWLCTRADCSQKWIQLLGWWWDFSDFRWLFLVVKWNGRLCMTEISITCSTMSSNTHPHTHKNTKVQSNGETETEREREYFQSPVIYSDVIAGCTAFIEFFLATIHKSSITAEFSVKKPYEPQITRRESKGTNVSTSLSISRSRNESKSISHRINIDMIMDVFNSA